jgi:lipopolysaccharide/colanic/teichoic acid biosynthesis glycosyltransferase
MSVVESKRIAPRRHHAASVPARRSQATNTLSPPPYFRWKAVIDRICASLLLAPGLPLIALMVLVVRLTSRGPGIYRQIRVGRNGRKFKMYKIRTMRHDAEAGSGAVWANMAHDPRITPVGCVLRKFHLDELPQLFNVLKGEMSLVGPRPERPEFVHVLAETIPGYRDRLAVSPGVTGLSQLNLPADSDLNSVRRKLALDCEYIRHAGLWLDARLFLCTGFRLLKIPESWLLPFFGLSRTVSLHATPASELCAGENSGNGDGNGSDHAPPTPTDILQQAAAESADGDGDGRHGRRHKGAHAHHAPVKPR